MGLEGTQEQRPLVQQATDVAALIQVDVGVQHHHDASHILPAQAHHYAKSDRLAIGAELCAIVPLLGRLADQNEAR